MGNIHPSSGVPDLTTEELHRGHVRSPLGPLRNEPRISFRLDKLVGVLVKFDARFRETVSDQDFFHFVAMVSL